MYPLLFLLAAGLNILLGWHDWPAVLAGSLNDPDSYMRLLRIEQGIRAGHLVVSVARDDSGAGVYVEWSRLLDALLWLMAAPLAPFLGWHKALYAAGVVLGPLGVGFLGLVLAWAVEPFATRRYLWTAAIAAAVLPGFTTIAIPGVVHYHVLLLAMIALTTGCVARAWRDDRWYGFLAGAAGGFAIWLTPETMPFVLAAYAMLLLRWWQVGNGVVLLATAAGCFDVLGFGFFVDPPGGGYGNPAVDRISYVYLTMALLLLGGTALLARLQGRSWPWLRRARGPLGVALLGGLMAVWIVSFPRVVMGPYGILPPAEARAFFGVISEQQPLRGAALLVFLFPGLCAVLYAFWRGLAGQPVDFEAMAVSALFAPRLSQRAVWLHIALCGVVCLVLGARFMLFAGFPTLLAAGMLPVAISEMSSAWAEHPGRAGFARIAALALVLAVPLATALAAPAPVVAGASAGATYPSCDLRHIAPLLAPVAGKIVLAEPQYTPELLYRSKIETVGSLYHHGVAGYMRDRAAWRAMPGTTVPAAITATGADFVLFCPLPGRYALVEDMPRETFWDAMEANAPPPWLSLMGSNAEGWRLYKITR